VAPFRHRDDDLGHPLDWQLLRVGPVALYLSRGFLDADIGTLRELGYVVRRFDCSTWKTPRDMYVDTAKQLTFPEAEVNADPFGPFLDAMYDRLTDAQPPEDGGLLIVLDNLLDYQHSPEAVLDVYARASRRWLLFGRRFLILARVDDPRFTGPADLGSTPARWNPREWLDKSRAL
jgi:hypothetical protein